MILYLLIIVSVIALLFASVTPRLDSVMAWIVGFILALCAGLFTEGYDYEQYVLMIESVRNLGDEDLTLRLFAAKDPLFLLIIEFTGALTDDIQLVFLVVAIFSCLTKVLATSVIPGKRTLFMALYAIFIAPGLEFAAIRAGLAIGLTMMGYLAIQRWPWTIWWVSLGFASHMSVILVTIGRILARYWRVLLLCLVLVIPVINFNFSVLIDDDPRYVHYLDNQGTIFAFGLPALTFITLLLMHISINGNHIKPHALLADDWLRTTYFMISVSLVLTIPIVTAATRVMELAWVILTLQMIARDSQLQCKAQIVRFVSWATLVGLLSWANLVRGTWAILI